MKRKRLQLYVKEIRELLHVIVVAPGKDIYVLGSRKSMQEAVSLALMYARLLDISKQDVFVGGYLVSKQSNLGFGFAESNTKEEGEDRHC